MEGRAGEEPHIPVMLDEVLEHLDPQPGETIVDGTLGNAGYSRAILGRGARVVGFDRDPDAAAAARKMALDGLTVVEDRFSRMAEHVEAADGVVLDIGVSSMQLDRAERGFSFRADGPLDMRMEGEGPSAADAVNRLPRSQITRILGLLGEERQAGRVAAAIERARPVETTAQLQAAVASVLSRSKGTDPATRTFQALRIFVNRELDELAAALGAAERILRPGGRLVVVSFHSLEDRIVKRFLLNRAGNVSGSRHLPGETAVPATFEPLHRGPLLPGASETASNPRARSARLRAARRTDAPARTMPALKALGVPDLSSAWADLTRTQR